MSIRNIRQVDDLILRKKSKPVLDMSDKYRELILDMKETMLNANGCGLAAVQVGVLRNIIVVNDIKDRDDDSNNVIVFINPEIISKSNETNVLSEGCLSVEGKRGDVERPNEIKVKALNENMEEFEMTAKDFLARIICHEVDHLFGVLYIDKVIDGVHDIDEDIEED